MQSCTKTQREVIQRRTAAAQPRRPQQSSQAAPFQVVQKVKLFLRHLDHLQLLFLLLFLFPLCISFYRLLLPWTKSEGYWVSAMLVQGTAGRHRKETHLEGAQPGFVSATAFLPLGKGAESQTRFLQATPPWGQTDKALSTGNRSCS